MFVLPATRAMRRLTMADSTNLSPTPKPWIEDIHAYIPGKSASADGKPLIKLSANENPLGTSPAVHAAMGNAVHPNRYPDGDSRELRKALSAKHGIDTGRIVCGTGSGELLNCAVQAFAGRGDEVLFSRYSFSLYPLLAQKVGATPVMADDADYAASVDNLLAAVTERTRVIIVDNPNNPIGCWLPADEIARLHAGLAADVLLIVDQAYAEYLAEDVDDGAFELAIRHNNVLVMRTFSKAYGIAGERVGWATGAPPLIDMINRIRGAFNVSNHGQVAALAALGDDAWIARCRKENAVERARFVEAMEALGNHGIRPLPSEANFVLVLFEGVLTAEGALSAIAEAGYAVRHLPGQGLSHALRITIGQREDMDAVATAIRQAAEAA